MPDYLRSKIYKICSKSDDSVVYIGATALPYLCQRMGMHRVQQRKHKNACRSSVLFERFGIDECQIELIEAFPCLGKRELAERERFYIQEFRRMGLEVVNHGVPLRTPKEWYQDNRAVILEKKKKAYQERKRLILNNAVETLVEDRVCGVE
jgi:hypothetical protein